MKFRSLEELLHYIYNELLKDDYERYLEFSLSDEEALIVLFENRIPLRVHFEDVYYEDGNIRNKLTAEVYVELCRNNIGVGWLKLLDEICTVIEANEEIFKTLLKKGNKK